METFFSTSDVHPRDRLSYMRDVACKAFVELDCRTDSGPAFSATLRSGSLAQVGLSIVETDPCEVVREQSHIAGSRSDDILVSVQLSGSTTLVQDDRETRLRPGHFALYDTQRRYVLNVERGTRQLVLKVPRACLETRLGSVSPFTAQSMRSNNPIGGLAFRFFRLLPSRSDTLDGIAARQIADQALDLLALSCTRECRHTMSTQTSTRAATLLSLKSIIESRLFDPRLTPSNSAEMAGISVRYANTLLANEDTSLERYIFSRRLERTRSMLDDATQDYRSISEIAHSHGFSSASHFSRRFKEAFSVTPTEYRRQRQ